MPEAQPSRRTTARKKKATGGRPGTRASGERRQVRGCLYAARNVRVVPKSKPGKASKDFRRTLHA